MKICTDVKHLAQGLISSKDSINGNIVIQLTTEFSRLPCPSSRLITETLNLLSVRLTKTVGSALRLSLNKSRHPRLQVPALPPPCWCLPGPACGLGPHQAR